MMSPTSTARPLSGRGAPRAAVIAATAALATLIAGFQIAERLQPPGYAASRESALVLTATGTPYRWLTVLTLVGTGLLVGIAGWALPAAPAHPAGRRPRGAIGPIPGAGRLARGLIVMAGVGLIALALLPRPSPETPVPVVLVAGATVAGLALWPAAESRSIADAAWRRSMLLLALVGSLVLAARGPSYGAYERAVALILLGHLVLVAARRWWDVGHRLGPLPVRMTLATAALSLLCAVGGVLTTVIAPAPVATKNFVVGLSFSPSLADSARVVVPTVLGDVEARFTGLAPGVRADLQVRADITSALGTPNASLDMLRPTPAEIDAAVREAVTGLGLRFGFGCLLVALAAVAIRAGIRRKLPGPRTALVAISAAALALGLTGAAVAKTYRGTAPNQLSATGLLGEVQRNSTLFDDVAIRSAQVAPYLRNVVAVSEALRERYQPADIEQSRVLRILLISDVHAGNQYPLLRSLIESEQVDLVIDSGDLVNFGTVAEGEISGVFRGIADLKVPYVFVRGNHDATGPDDEAVLRRLRGIPNVILLQPDSTRYQELSIAGVRIAGFNDPRWFGDDGKGSAQKQQPAKERWLASFVGRPVPDIIVSHEPWAVQGIQGAGVLINGHMHSAFRDGNRIQVGTFTGGGPLAHFIAGEGSEELVGQPSAFDILDIGHDCRVSALTRYRFSQVVEGRPSFDDISLVNGSAIDTRPVDPTRGCAAGLPPNLLHVPRVGGS